MEKVLPSSDCERRIRELLDSGEEQAAVTFAIESYGPEILGFLFALTRDRDVADDLFSIVCEETWRCLAKFRWESKLRTWLYSVARGAYCRHRRSSHERRRRPLSEVPDLENIQAEVRTRTATFLRTETRLAVDRLRSALSDDDQMLLILRLDRKLAWLEIARIMQTDLEASEESLKREAAACRKRFERAKRQLRELAIRDGLLDE